MSFFSKILEKLGLSKDKPAATAAAAAKPVAPARPAMTAKPATVVKPVAPAPSVGTGVKPATMIDRGERDDAVEHITSAKPAVPAPTPISEVDVVKKLEQLGAGSGLDWKVSIVDLLKLLDIDSSRTARNELAKELGCPEEFMKDSAKMNTWLHKTVLRKIAENGGNIPKELLD